MLKEEGSSASVWVKTRKKALVRVAREGKRKKEEGFSYRRERRKKQSSARFSVIKNLLTVGRGC